MPLKTDKHFTRKSNLVFPSLVPISNQSNAKPPADTQLLCCGRHQRLHLAPASKGCHISASSWAGNCVKASCGFEFQITLLVIEQRHVAFTFFFPLNVLFSITGQLNNFIEFLHCSQRWLHELAIAMGKQRHGIQYNSSFAYNHQVPNVLRQSFVKFMLPIHHCYCLKVA